ncbi:hypothetical protein [Candidatus Magnetomonas plexicatena]|uniref:hypothetical protein n=1 Tax=Candidatus Magnetomonas plexicatena TaxID=2552947 RepID=UPI001C766683|nr:hypothetical protein E2O03_002130 [Nitrospirales bacterium LBB_01]
MIIRIDKQRYFVIEFLSVTFKHMEAQQQMKENVNTFDRGSFLTAHPIFNPIYVLSFLTIMLTTFKEFPDFKVIKGSLNTHEISVRSEKSEPDFRNAPTPGGNGKFYAAAVTPSSPDVLYIIKEGTGGGTVSIKEGDKISWKGQVGSIGHLKKDKKLSIIATPSSHSFISSWNGCNTVTGSDCSAIFSSGKVIKIKFEKIK